MKFIILLTVFLATLQPSGAAPDPFSRKITGTYHYDSFEEALREMEQKSACKVSCPQEIKDFMHTLWLKRGGSLDFAGPAKPADKGTVRAFLDGLCKSLSLRWHWEEKSNTITLNLAWKVNDGRKPEELFQFVCLDQGPQASDLKESPLKFWQDKFDALLSRPENYALAWKVRQQASLENALFFPNPLKPMLIQPIVNTAGEKFYFFLMGQPIFMYPGNGSASYYWFRENGILAGAGLMNTGHRCNFVDAAIGRNDENKPTELQLVLKFNNDDFIFARMALKPEGLELKGLTDGHGDKMNNDGYSIGESLLKK